MNANERFEDYLEWSDRTKKYPVSELCTVINSDIKVDPNNGIRYSTIVTCPDDVLKFVSKFTSYNPFLSANLIKFKVDPDDYANEDYEYKINKIAETTIHVNEFFDVDEQLQVTVGGDVVELEDLSEIEVCDVLEYPSLISFYGEDSWDRSGDSSVRSLVVVPLSKVGVNKIHAG